MDHIFTLHSPVDGHSDCFQFLTIVNSISIIVSLNFNKEIGYYINYNCSLGCLGGNYEEKELFATKEDLKNYLFGK